MIVKANERRERCRFLMALCTLERADGAAPLYSLVTAKLV